jgi:hypothetical protein
MDANSRHQSTTGDAKYAQNSPCCAIYFFNFFSCGIAHSWYFICGIKTKLDNANWFTIRHADTPLKKAFLKQARPESLWPGLFCPAFRRGLFRSVPRTFMARNPIGSIGN